MTDTRLNAPGGTIGSETKFSTRGPASPTTDISATDNLSVLGDGAFNPLHVSTTWLAQQIATAIAAIPPTAPTVEHVTTVANVAVCKPAVDVTFITEGGDADGRQVMSLADGTTDGFEKTIAWPVGGVPVVGYRVVPAHGPTVNWGDTDGAVTYRWNTTLVAWEVQSAYKFV